MKLAWLFLWMACSIAFSAQLTTSVLVSTNQKCATLYLSFPPPPLSCDSVNDSSLKAYYRLDEPDGIALDTKGSNNLTDNNGVSTQVGKIGTSRSFTAATVQFLSIADNTDLSPGSSDFTVGFWWYFGGTLIAGQSPGIVSKWTFGGGQNEFTTFLSGDDQMIEFDVSSNGSNETIVKATSFTGNILSTWHYGIVWKNGTDNTINIQIDNGAVDSAAFSGSIFNSNSPFTIGSIGTATTWTGVIDEVFFTKRVLTAIERQALYNMGLACRPSGL